MQPTQRQGSILRSLFRPRLTTPHNFVACTLFSDHIQERQDIQAHEDAVWGGSALIGDYLQVETEASYA